MKRKILAVDDSKMMLRIIGSCIEPLGYEVLKAGNGREALTTLATHYQDVALMLLDWNMPEMNGIETLQAVKADPRYRTIPVMMVTTESDQENVQKARQAGASYYLTKPFGQQDLTARLAQILR